MFWELFRFELYYRRRRATTYVYFFVIFLTSFAVLLSPTLSIAGTSDATSANSPYTIAVLMVVLSFLFTLITSSLVGVAVVRDVEHEMAPIIFTTPIHKGSYLFGRFAGSLVTLVLLNTGIIFGALLAYSIGPLLPDVTWHTKEVLPFNVWTYLQPFLIFSVTNIFITGSLFFAAGALVRRPVVIYSQGVALLMLYQIANIFYLRDLDSRHIAALIDPFGVQTFVYMTRYWTPAEQNTLLVPFEGAMLYNRLIWVSIAIIVLIVTYWRFSFTARGGFARKKKKAVDTNARQPVIGPIPQVTKSASMSSRTRQLLSTTWFHFRGIWTEVPFIAIAGTGLLVLIINSLRMGTMLGTSSYPTTTTVLTMLGSFSLFFTILLIFYSGEIVWKERQHRIHSIVDSTPVPNHLVILSKFLSLCLVYLSFLVGFFLYGILLQAAHGYYQFDLKAYFGTLSESFLGLCLATILAILIQSATGNKFLGFVITVVFIILIALLPLFGVEHEMLIYGSGSLGAFSQMNGYGHFAVPFAWLKTYWSALGLVFFVAAVFFYRPNEKISLSLKVLGLTGLSIFAGIGTYIYYNTSVVNHFQSSRQIKAVQARYDEEMKQYGSRVQPNVVEVNVNVDLYPKKRSFEAKGYYYLKNNDSVPLSEIQLHQMVSPQLHINELSFGRNSTVIEDHPDLGYRLFKVDPPLAPGDSLRMDFAMDYTQKGFKSKPQNTDLVYNGTFFRNNYLPSIGFSKEPDRVRFKAIVSTDSAQLAIAPGRLTKDWYENDRHYQQFEVERPIPNVYAFLSGEYKVRTDKWNDVDLGIYYHPAHAFNVDRMMQGLKDGLEYYSKNFGSKPESPVRIVEFPRYTTAAQSFPGTIAFSEGAGFIVRIADPNKDLDVPYYVTAHELAHQWWGEQVLQADAPGKAMLSEGMPQYSALMVMSHTFPPEVMQMFLRYELDAYLKGRTEEKQKELPLIAVRDQQYISYNKSALAFFAIQDYIGEENMNIAFRRFHEKWAFRSQPHPTSKDLIDEIRKVTPDSLSYLISDTFEHITLYENKANEAAYSVLPNGRYEVTMTVSTQKLQVDPNGLEKPVPMNDWIDVGIYSKDKNGKPKLVYLRKHRFSRPKNTLTISLGEQPIKVAIDPLHKLIDHHSNDNMIDVGTVVELAN